MSTKSIYARIKAVCTSLAKSYDKVHLIAVECLEHAAANGDARPMLALINGLPKATYREGLIFWTRKFSPIRFDADLATATLLKSTDARYVPFNLDDAKAKPFWTLAEVEEALSRKPMTIEGLAKSVVGFKAAKLKQVQKQHDEGLIDDAQLAGMKAYLDSVTITVANHAANKEAA